MLFSSIVFMSRTFRGQWISVLLVFIIKLSVASNSQIQNYNASSFDADFGNFLKDLGSKVYKVKKIDVTQNEIRSSRNINMTPPHIKNYRRNKLMNTFNTQKAILQDVLMMKLVSYYEDKYKLTHLEPTTTESITIENTIKPNVLTKQNTNQYNFIEKEEALRSNTIPKPTKRVVPGKNRRMTIDHIKTYDEYQVPEVVIF